MPEEKRQPTAEAHAEASVQLIRSMTRKNPNTGKSNYPTFQFGKITNTNYQKGKKTITTKKYRRIDD